MKLNQSQKKFMKMKNNGYKMIFCIRSDLKMSKGKIAAQCSHGAIDMYKKMMKKHSDMLEEWEETGSKKIVTKCTDKQYNILIKKLQMAEMDYTVIKDAGCTEVNPGTETVLVIFDKEKKVNPFTGNFKTL